MKSMITEIFNGKVGCLDSMALSENHDALSAATSDTYDNLVATLNERRPQTSNVANEVKLRSSTGSIFDALGFENLDEVTHAFAVGVKLGLRLEIPTLSSLFGITQSRVVLVL